MVRRRRSRRPWYRTRAYRLTRTAVLATALVAGGVRWAGSDEPTGSGAVAVAESPGPAAATGPGRDAGRTDRTNAQRPVAGPRGARAGRTAPARPARPARPPRPLPRSRATAIDIPYFRLAAPAVAVRLDRERRLTVPPVDDPKVVGWYEGGATPGERGTAVVVGHRDTRTGPAVFAALGQLPVGRLIEARRADGRVAVYTVDAVKTYEKARFPNKEVYGDRQRPELRLITCGGVYDRRKGYAGNIVVFAHLTQTRGRARTT
ncbi:class F sortase [Streptomyces sp. NPDC005813]|uniref:class F sortase n=1 Tax=Streptomyces sp. NPDC005813 TaxID=3155592 RepID=UPI0033DC7EA7